MVGTLAMRPGYWLVVLAVLFTTRLGYAQSDADRRAARSAARQGVEAFTKGDHEQALDLLQRAEQLVHAPTHLLFIARAYAELGRLVQAHETYLKLVHENLQEGAPKAFFSAQDDARRELKALEARIPRVVIQVEGADPREVKLLIDSAPLSNVVIGVPTEVNPGRHVVQASAPGRSTASVEFVAEEEETSTVDLALSESLEGDAEAGDGSDAAGAPMEPGAATEAEAPLSEPPEPAAAPSKKSSAGPGPWILGGVGAAALGAGGLFGVLTLRAISQAEAICPDQTGDGTAERACTSSDIKNYEFYDNQAHTFRTISYIGFGVGGAALVGAATWLVLRKPKKESAMRVEPVVGSAWGLQARGRF